MNLSESRQLFSSWLSHPYRTGAVVPSGLQLAAAMARRIDPAGNGSVVDLGAGTGPIASALLERGVAPGRIVAVETDARLCDGLARRFPQLTVIRGEASELSALLARAGVSAPVTILSSLPMLVMRGSLRRRTLEGIVAAMGAGGTLYQFTYAPFSPIGGDEQAALGIAASRVGFAPRNLPPATVWRYRSL